MIKKIILILIIATSIYAKDSIIDVDQVLKDNQAIVINAKTNSIKYILEILPNGEVIKTYISKKDQEKLIKELNLNITSSNNMVDTKKSPIKIWDKKKIIYEQQVEKIDIDR